MIVFDVQAVQSAAHGERGIARFVGDLARTLAAEHPDVVDVFAWNDRFPDGPRLRELGLGDRLRPFSELRGEHVELVHVNSPFEHGSVADLVAPLRPRRTVATCYDLIPYVFPQHYLVDQGSAIRYRSRLPLLVAADHVVTDSQSAADDAHDLLGIERDRLTVIGAGVSDDFVPPTDDRSARLARLRDALPGLEDDFVLVPSGIDWRKNVEGSIAAYAALPDELRARHQFVLACRVNDDQRRSVLDVCDRLGVADRVLLTGYVSDATLVELYQTCTLVLFASKYEGFGLPVLEARRCGARVISSNAAALPEVLHEPTATFNPWLTDEITATLERALTDERFQSVLDDIPDAGHTWSRAAQRLVGVYRRISAETAPARRADRPEVRLGVATPLPPTESGIAGHSARLLTAMASFDDVEPVAFVDGDSTASRDRVPVPVHDLATLPTRWIMGELDAVLYCVGNHELHRPYLTMLRLVPGAVLLHDVRLDGPWPHLPHDEEADADPGVALLAELADGLLVQSGAAQQLVAASTGRPAVDVGPHHCPAVPTGTGRAGSASETWIVTAGVADESKATPVVVAAMERLVAEQPDVRAAVVGRHSSWFVEDSSPVVAVDEVGDAEFDAWIARATIVVQLRARSAGESSGVVALAMAHGRPTVVSDVGAMSELPADAVVHVPVGIDADRLAAVLADLLDDPARRDALARRSGAWASEHPAGDQARRIVDAVRARRLTRSA